MTVTAESDEPRDDAMPPELGDHAQALLGQLAREMTPSGAAEARAFERLAETIAAEPTSQSWRRRVRRMARGLGLHLWRIAIPVVVLAAVVFVGRALTRNELGDAAALQNARLMLEEKRYRGAYDVLKQHAERFKGRDAAEARTPLVLDALCGMGERSKAEEVLARYLEFAPDSELADRRRDVCPLGTEPARRLDDPSP